MNAEAIFSSPLGDIRLRSTNARLSGLDFIDPAAPASAKAAGSRPSEGLLQGKPLRKFRVYESGSLPLFAGAPPLRKPRKPESPEQCLVLGPGPVPAADLALLELAAAELSLYFKGQLREFSLPLHLEGSDFQRKVWQELLKIPFGVSLSYGELAESGGWPASHGRAVGTAVGSNPISIVVPCHRIIGKTGAMTGYSGGLWRKLHLLSLEGFRVDCIR